MGLDVLLSDAIKRVNDRIGHNEVVSSLVVFGTIPIIPLTKKLTNDQRTTMEAIKTTRDEVLRIRSEQRISTTNKSKIPPSAKYIIKTRDEVLAYSYRERI